MDTLLYIAVINVFLILFELVISFPTEWYQVLTTLIVASWSVNYFAFWLMALKFPTKYTYLCPVVVILQNLLTLLYYKIKIGGL